MENSQDIWVFISVVFLTYFLLSWIYEKLDIWNLEQALQVRNGLRLLNMRHGLGIVLLGVLFYEICPDLRFLLNYIEIPRLYILLPYVALVFSAAYISYLASKKAKDTNDDVIYYKFEQAWSYFIIRTLFLLSYEFFFRGVLFFTFLEYFSLVESIALTTILYLIIHVFDSKGKMMGTIPFGIILCVITYETQSIWYAFVLHLTLSAVYEISIFYGKTLKTLKS
ncbi:CPBP family intramembrane metalloprotease [Tamlana fucoidanivorans]|uniref:CPBP family intramembrane metalloprotease n=1 Tax=Allotamlana fucoidanivorans TaxID=2583814 RepID=A0A5C4SLA9_9FLAO|nr:CPBP family intramembrane glutamic endopeptidase [Tamlana fucoidanivorans]TNJ44686.1 CPBP family intramembrane metalloprotease [Tamlana fucoidanivorans]